MVFFLKFWKHIQISYEFCKQLGCSFLSMAYIKVKEITKYTTNHYKNNIKLLDSVFKVGSNRSSNRYNSIQAKVPIRLSHHAMKASQDSICTIPHN